jgi:hypothetical protein
MNTSRTVGWRDWHRKSLEIRQAKARARGEEVLLLIQAWRQDGRSWAQLAELLDAAGIRASRGGRWHPDRLRRVWARWLRGELRLLLPSQSRHFCRRSAETHVQSVPGAVVSPSGRTGRLGRSAPPQLKPHLAWQSLHEAPYRKLRRRDRELKEGITDEQT